MEAQAQRRQTVGRTFGISIVMVAVFGTSTLYAQAPSRSLTTIVAAKTEAAPAPSAAAAEPDTSSVRLLVGRSAIVNVGSPIQRVSLTSSDIADALVTTPSELLINGKTPGTISMFVWDRAGAIRRYEIVVQRDFSRLTEQLKQFFPGEPIDVQANGKRAVLSGVVSSKDIVDKAIGLASGFVESKEEVTSLLQIRDGAPSNQVLLRVRFAEVSRNALTELGASYFSDGFKNTVGSVTTQQFPTPFFNQQGPMLGDRQVFSDFLNLFLFDFKNQLGAVIKALQTKGLFQSLAEPNLVAESGKEASFLAGGEFPIPVAQSSGGSTAITVQFKEFGIRLSFTPVVNGERIHLKVRPEVSTLDFSNAITLGGFRIPALSTRRTETELELQNGQTFAISGLLNNTMTSSMRKIPGIGDIPILGRLFQSKAAQKDQTELVVMITPEILPNNSTGVTPTLPRLIEPYLAPLPEKKLFDPPPPAFKPGAPGSSLNGPADGGGAATTSSPSAAAAAAVSAPPSATRAPTVLRAGATPTTSKASAAPGGSRDVPASQVKREPTGAEKKALERAHKEEQELHRAEVSAKAEQDKRLAKQAEEDRRQQKAEDERQATLAHEQAQRDTEAAKRAADEDRRQQKAEDARQATLAHEQAQRDAEAAKRAAEQAKQQAELDKKQQKAIAEAQARFKDAEAVYQAELAKKHAQ